LWHCAKVLIAGGSALFIHSVKILFVQSEAESVPLRPDNAENKAPYNLVFLSLVPNNPADPQMTAGLSSGEPT